MAPADERSLRIAKNSARNGFVVASAILAGFMAWQFLTLGDWAYELGMAFFLSQIAYFGSTLYYRRVM